MRVNFIFSIFLLSLGLIFQAPDLRAQTTIVSVSSGNDDGLERTTGSVELAYGFLQLGGASDIKTQGIRFQNVVIPAGAEIKDAYIEFYTYGSSPATSIDIYVETGGALSYAAATRNITNRSYTARKVNWVTDSWPVSLAPQRTNNLKNLIEDRRLNGWLSGSSLAFKFAGRGNNNGAVVCSYDLGAAYCPRLVIEYVNTGTGPRIVEPTEGKAAFVVSSSNDDGLEQANGSVALGLFYLQLGGTADIKTQGIRFQNVEIPSGAEIKDAYIEFYTYGGSPATSIDIYAETGNPLTYNTTSRNITSRNYATRKVNWVTERWATDLALQRTSNLKNLIEDRRLNGWNSGDSLAFKFAGLGNNNGAVVRSYDAEVMYRPRLVIEYMNNGAGPRIVEPTEGKAAFVVSSTNDDGLERTAGSVELPYAFLQLGGTADIKTQAVRFQNVEIPSGAEIKDAYIEFYTYGSSPAASIDIYAETGNPLTYNTTSRNITSRSYAARKVNWITERWATDLALQRTSNLKNLIEDRRLNGWRSGDSLAFKFAGLGNNNGAVVRSYDAEVMYRPRLVIEYMNNGVGPRIVEPTEGKAAFVVSSSNDDGLERTAGGVELPYAFLQLGGTTDIKTQGIRFQNVQIPSGAEIKDAYIEFYTYGSSPAARIDIYAEIGNAMTYAPVSKNINNRSYSSQRVNWITTAWATDATKQRTANLRSIIDENRLSGWRSGDSLAFKFAGLGNDNGAIVRSFDAEAMYRPRLVIEYLNTGVGPVVDSAISDPALMTQLYINEVAPQGTLVQKEDWVELYNDHDVPLYIKSGVYLSNKNGNRVLNELKDVYIAPKGYAVFIADKKPEQGSFHLNFDLKNSGETVYLSRLAGGTVVEQDHVTFGEIPFDQSYGRSPNGSGPFISFIKPTYRVSNDSGQKKLDVAFSQQRGVYPTGFNLTITAPPGTVVKYTLDGKFPSNTVGTVYTGPLTISKTTVVKTYAYSATGNSGVIAHTYVLRSNYPNETGWDYKSNITATEYAQAIGEIPIVSISADANPVNAWNQASIEYLDNNVYSGRENFFSNSMTRTFGQESVGSRNPGIKFKFDKDAGVKKAKYPFFDDYPGDLYPTPEKTHTLELKEGQDGPSRNVFGLGFMRYSEKITMNLQKEMKKYALDTRYVHLLVNGVYTGVKTLRNDFNPKNMEEVFGDDAKNYTEVDLQDGFFPTGTVWPGDGALSVWEAIRRLATSKDLQAFKQWVDLDDLIKFQIMFMFIDTEDEATCIVHNDAPNKMKAKFNINDTDGSFFGGVYTSGGDTTMVPLGLAGGGGNYKFKWLLASSINGPGGLFGSFMGSNTDSTAGNLEFKTLVKDAVLQNIGPASGTFSGAPGAPLSVANVQNKMNENVTMLNNVYKLDAAWMGYNGTVYNEWKNIEHKRIVAQVPERVRFSLRKWLEYGMAHTLQPVTITINANLMTIVNPNAGTNTYYTTDGSDPMGNNGIVSPAARLYTGAVTVTGGSKIVARAFKTNNWGPRAEKDPAASKQTNEISNDVVPAFAKSKDIDVYPNPVSSELHIIIPDNTDVPLSIYNMSGSVELTSRLNQVHNTVDMSHLSAGVYIIHVGAQTDKDRKVFKVIKK